MSDQDDAVMAALGRALDATDAPPPDTVVAARSAYAYLDLDARLAELLEDSAVDEMAGVRGAGTMRLVTYALGEATLELGIASSGRGHVDLLGTLVPESPGDCTVEHDAGTSEVVVDPAGRFHATGVPVGRVRLRLNVSDRSDGPYTTPWLVIEG